MFKLIARNKGLLALTAIMLASFLWITSQVSQSGGPTLLERGVSTLAYPFAKAAEALSDAAGSAWKNYFYHVGLVSENKRLKKELDQLRLENTGLSERLAQSDRLGGLLELKREQPYPSAAAKVVARDATTWFRSLWINAGSEDGVAKDMPVAVYTGLVGRVFKTYGPTSRVMLITDPRSSVSGMMERSRDTGILTGTGAAECTLRYVEKQSDVTPGDLVITSGLDGMFPEGMPLGVVKSVKDEAGGYFKEVTVSPTADLDHLEELLIIKYVPPVTR